jgi:DNA-binding ferritin-like protein
VAARSELVDQLIDRAFKLRDRAHRAHWRVTGEGSYARHQALSEFYDGLLDKVDAYVESHQGAFGLVGKDEDAAESTLEAIRQEMLWLTEHRSQIARGVPALENLLDELVGLHLRTLYKLEHLR